MNRPSIALMAIATSPLGACGLAIDFPPDWGGSYSCSPSGGSWEIELDAPGAEAIQIGLLDIAGGSWERTVTVEPDEEGRFWATTLEDDRLTCGELGDMAATVIMEWDGNKIAAAYYDAFSGTPKDASSLSVGVTGWDLVLETHAEVSAVEMSFWDIEHEELRDSFELQGGGGAWELSVGCLEVPCDSARFQRVLEFWGPDGEYLGSDG